MVTRVVGIVVGLLLSAASPAPAQPLSLSGSVASAASPANVHQVVARRPAARRGAAAKVGAPHTTAIPAGYAALPEEVRLSIQADLAWLGDYDPTAGGDADARTVDAIKAFQKRHGGKETGVLDEQQRGQLAAAVKGPEQAVGWRVTDDSATGARLGLPEKLVPRAGTARLGSRWTSGQGQIIVETFRLREASLAALFEDERRTTKLRHADASTLKSDSFTVSGMQGLKYFIVRAEARGTELRGVTVLYDQATEGIMAGVAVAIANTFQGFPDPNAGPPPGTKRGVEYSTAVVVSSVGHLVALGRVTEECQSITVPGLGHAERVAEDKASDLALLRLHGARNLTPAALAGESGKGDELTLVGIANPLAQAGGGAVTSVSARLSGQGLEPSPKPGFAGAAAVDAQGRFAGVVALRSPVLAGNGVVNAQATLVPAAAVRAFLDAHGVALASDRAAMEQSVVRVICVRK